MHLITNLSRLTWNLAPLVVLMLPSRCMLLTLWCSLRQVTRLFLQVRAEHMFVVYGLRCDTLAAIAGYPIVTGKWSFRCPTM
jgi:hypothetical protein